MNPPSCRRDFYLSELKETNFNDDSAISLMLMLVQLFLTIISLFSLTEPVVY